MKTLHLVLKKIFFDQILAGTKKNEIRELRPKSASKYIEYENDEQGEVAVPKKIDFLRLYMGYETNRPYFDIEVIDAQIILIVDENGNEIIFVENDVEYVEAQIEYILGEIKLKHNC
jgi:hypothetical protein